MSDLINGSERCEPISKEDQELLVRFAVAAIPALIPVSFIQNRGIAGDSIQLNVPALSNLAFQAAGYMVAEFKQRVSGEKPTVGINHR